MKSGFAMFPVLLICALAVSVSGAPQIGAGPVPADLSFLNETEIGSGYDGQMIADCVLEAEGATLVISASDIALTGLRLKGERNRVRITGDRVTLENCSLAGAETVVTGKGFFAVRSDFDELTFAEEAADAEAARCAIGGAVAVRGKNQVLYGNRCRRVEAEGAANLSAVKNEGESITLRNVSFVNLSENRWKEGIDYDDRGALWGSDLPGLLDDTDHAGADRSRLPQNDKTRFGESTVRETIYSGGAFVSLNEFLASAANSSDEEVIIPAGIYLNAEPVVFADRKNLTLAAYGALTRFRSYSVTAVRMTRCAGFAVEGLTTDHMRVANAQGTVLSTDGESFVWKPDEGYGFDITDPAFFSPTGIGLAFHPDTRLPYMDCYQLHYVKNEDGTFTVSKAAGLSAGDRFTIRGLGGHVFDVADSGNASFCDMTIWSGSAFAFNVELGPGRVTILRTLVVPGPKPEGAAEERVHSTCDACHFSNVRLGPVIEDSLFTDMTDDGLNVNGHYAVADAYDPETRTFSIVKSYTVMYGTYPSHTASYQKGDKVRVLSRDFKLIAETTAEGPVEEGKLTVSDSLELPAADVILQNTSAQSAGFVVRNTAVERIRSRGLLIKAGDGLIEHCTLKDVRTAGVLVTPESVGWPEFGFTSNLTIRNNLFVGTGYADPKIRLFAPISVCGENVITPEPAGQLHQNLLVEGNLIQGRRNETAIWISHVRGGVVRGNTVMEPDPAIFDEGGTDSLPAPIAVDSSTDVQFLENRSPEGDGVPVDILEAVAKIRVGM
ncbi:MAG: hypothetical protein IJG60_06075 [Thermoguttaceae bacterium]|nr:hypothetical protein [Thermoguttaceae bacterium]